MIEAARAVFAEKGFLEARIADITERAGVAHGTFYTYFESKEAIFRELALQLQREGFAREDDAEEPPPTTPYERIERANRRYLTAYARNASLMAIVEQVATFNRELLEIRVAIRRAYVDRAVAGIERFQAEGVADPSIDAYYAANMLGAMVDRFAYVWMVLGEEFEFDQAVRTLSELWARALGIHIPRR